MQDAWRIDGVTRRCVDCYTTIYSSLVAVTDGPVPRPVRPRSRAVTERRDGGNGFRCAVVTRRDTVILQMAGEETHRLRGYIQVRESNFKCQASDF